MAYLKTGHFICSCCKEECNKDCPSYKKFTHKKNNADRIRSMSDEELAEFLEALCPSCNWTLALNGMTGFGFLKQEVSANDS